MYNVEIRNAIKKAGLFGYELAAALGVSESSFSRKLARKELPNDQKQHVAELPAVAKVIEEEKAKMGEGRVLVRASGTEALVRVMVEGVNKEAVERAARVIADTIAQIG